MPILYPGADIRLLAGKSTTPLNPLVIDVHTMVGTLGGTEAYFTPAGRAYSHFGTGGDGRVWQWQELDYRAASDLHGNGYCISIENEDRGPLFPDWSGSDVPRFTAEQAEALSRLIAWLCARFGIPPHLIPDSIYGRTGPGYHRLGIDPYRVATGVLWSSAYAKACPGDRRIAQLRDEIMPRVRHLLAVPLPPPVTNLEDLVPFPVIATASDGLGRHWTALLPGKLIVFNATNPGLPEINDSQARTVWAPNWVYEGGVAAGWFSPVKRITDDGRGNPVSGAGSVLVFDRACAAAQQYSGLITVGEGDNADDLVLQAILLELAAGEEPAPVPPV